MENNYDNLASGFLLVNKEEGPTSHDIIYKLRKITSIKKIGHAGTLDPFASGLLIVAIGRESTKKIDQYVKLDKKYIATLRLGATSSTFDPEGEIIETQSSKIPIEKIKAVVNKFSGKQLQVPPMFSAKKINGKKLYDLARKGIEVERQPVEINVFNIKIISYEWPALIIEIHVSSGTYIRSIANDIGEKLGCGAYLTKLKRTQIGEFDIKNSYLLSKITDKNWPTLLN